MWRRALVTSAALAAGVAIVGPAFAFSEINGLPRGTTPPDWALKPTSEQVAYVYPELANDLSLGGHVTLSCRIGVRGLVDHCRIVEETPPGLKFGRAAMRLTPMFRFRPAMTITGPLPSMVNVPVRFVPPPDDLRRAIPFMALLAALTTGLAWRRRRIDARGWNPAGRPSRA